MAVAPIFARVPRYIYSIVSTAMSVYFSFYFPFPALYLISSLRSLIPIAIIGQTRFFGTLVNILSKYIQ